MPGLKFRPLVLAAAHNHADILIKLLQRGDVDIKQTDASQRTALIQACHSGSDRCLTELLRDGRSSVNSCDGDGRGSLIHACMTSHAMAAQQLLKQPRLKEHLCDGYGRNAVSYAAEKAGLAVIKRLVRLQASIAQQDAEG